MKDTAVGKLHYSGGVFSFDYPEFADWTIRVNENEIFYALNTVADYTPTILTWSIHTSFTIKGKMEVEDSFWNTNIGTKKVTIYLKKQKEIQFVIYGYKEMVDKIYTTLIQSFSEI